MRMRFVLFTVVCLLGLTTRSFSRADDVLLTDGHGHIREMSLNGRTLYVSAGPMILSEDGLKWTTLDQRSTELTEAQPLAAVRHHADRLILDPQQSFRYNQTITREGDLSRLHATLTAEHDSPGKHAEFHVTLPQPEFCGGRVEWIDGDPKVEAAALPKDKAANRSIATATARGFIAHSAAGDFDVEVRFDHAVALQVRDERHLNQTSFTIALTFTPSGMKAGDSVALDMAIKVTGQTDHSPATLKISPATQPVRFDGFGGNFAFHADVPISDYTLETLHPRWARVELRLDQWMASVTTAPTTLPTDAGAWAEQDRPGSLVHTELEMAAKLARKKVPTILSIWSVPKWAYSKIFTNRVAGDVAPQHWPAIVQATGAFLVYARDHYQFEPELFSFNEPDSGVNVRLSPVEVRDVVKRFGAEFNRLGLKTRILLGDVASPRVAPDYLAPAMQDAEAMSYVGAIGLHSWGGGSDANYQDWRKISDETGKPLMVTELGFDADFRRVRGWLHTHYYAMKDLRLTQELLRKIRPATLLEWEYTDDYPVATRNAAGEWEGDYRFAMLRQFTDLIPPGSTMMDCKASRDDLLATAFNLSPAFALHIANFGPARDLAIDGLPVGVKNLNIVYTCEGERNASAGDAVVAGGSSTVHLKARSLTTLSTAALAPLPTTQPSR